MTNGTDSFVRLTIIQVIMCLFVFSMDTVFSTPEKKEAIDICIKQSKFPMKDDNDKPIPGSAQTFFMDHFTELSLAIHILEIIGYVALQRQNYRWSIKGKCTFTHKHLAFLYLLISLAMVFVLYSITGSLPFKTDVIDITEKEGKGVCLWYEGLWNACNVYMMIFTSIYIIVDRAMRDLSLKNYGHSCLEKIHFDS
jgi:hypothetical protein